MYVIVIAPLGGPINRYIPPRGAIRVYMYVHVLVYFDFGSLIIL